MTSLENGTYATKKGSTMKLSGKHAGISDVSFDWVEEDACFDCVVESYPDDDGCMVWVCDNCGGGSAELIKQPTEVCDG